jgi:hypothetical protein
MTGNALHMQWPLTSQSHGSVSQREQWQQMIFCQKINSVPQNHSNQKQAFCCAWVCEQQILTPPIFFF